MGKNKNKNKNKNHATDKPAAAFKPPSATVKHTHPGKHGKPKPSPQTWSIALAADDDDDEVAVEEVAMAGTTSTTTTADADADAAQSGGSGGGGTSHLTSIQQSMASKLSGSRFRMLNEDLYTSSSTDSFRRFQQDPSLFEEYHRGFREQARTWADQSAESIKGGKKGAASAAASTGVSNATGAQSKSGSGSSGGPSVANNNPVIWIKHRILNRYSGGKGGGAKESAAKGGGAKVITVADFGCGDCVLRSSLPQANFQVHCLDLVSPTAPHPLANVIRACNIAQIPFIPTESVDVGVYSLALMGTDVFNILKEGSRVLKVDGRLYVAEVRSRFLESAKEKGAKEKKRDLMPRFLSLMTALGFEVVERDCKSSNKFFVLMEFRKVARYKKELKAGAIEGEGQWLLPCIYKRR
jgi:ribosomal RNA-processing protein 8